jgi:hypothetical protein
MTTLTKNAITPTWTASKIQEVTAKVFASNSMAAHQATAKAGEQVLADYKATARQFKVAQLKELSVSNALELATALAEMEVNLFGSKIDISGDEKAATMIYNQCAMWEAMKEVGQITPEQEKQMSGGMQTCMQDLAHDLGLNAKVTFEGKSRAVSFTKA